MYSFVKNRFTAYVIALILFVGSLASPFLLPFHQGIDLTGGIQIEYSVENASVDDVLTQTKSALLANAKNSLPDAEKAVISDMISYRVSGTNNIIVEAGIDESAAKKTDGSADLERIDRAKNLFLDALKAEYATVEGATISQQKYVNIGASFGQYIKDSAYLTLTLAVIVISIYIMYAFWGSIPGMASWPFAMVTGLSLLHDVVVAFGLYVLTSAFLPEFKIDTFFITAMLTVLGYSINDTIVIMDRVRAQLKDSKQKNMPLEKIVDAAIHGTMRRSLFTSLTVLIVLVMMFFFGPDAIRGFTLALIFGTIVGTYSSIFLAAPALVDIIGQRNRKKSQ